MVQGIRRGGGGRKNGLGSIHLKQLAEALKITAELTVQEWNDFGLAVTRMVDVHVNRQEGEGGGEGDGEGERGGNHIDNQQERVRECV